MLGFFLVYVGLYTTGAVAMAATDLDPVTALSAAASALNLIGPGLGQIGPDTTWEAVPAAGRPIAAFLMIAGRLEVFTVVALLAALFRAPGRM